MNTFLSILRDLDTVKDAYSDLDEKRLESLKVVCGVELNI